MNWKTRLKNLSNKEIALFLLGFLLPIVGFVLYFVWRKNNARPAKMVVRGAWVGLIIALIIMSIIGHIHILVEMMGGSIILD